MQAASTTTCREFLASASGALCTNPATHRLYSFNNRRGCTYSAPYTDSAVTATRSDPLDTTTEYSYDVLSPRNLQAMGEHSSQSVGLSVVESIQAVEAALECIEFVSNSVC